MNVSFREKLSLRLIAYLIVCAFALAEGCFLIIPRAFLLDMSIFAKMLGVVIALATIFFPLMIRDAMKSAYTREQQWDDLDRHLI